MRSSAIAVLLAGLPFWIAASCSLPAVHGRVVDRETHAPIAGVRVVEQRRGARSLSDVAVTLHARVTSTDAAGRFSFPGETPAGAQVAIGGSRAPVYVLAHPRYGLVRTDERATTEAELAFEMSLSDVTAQQSLAALCASPPREDWERELAAAICSRR